MVGEGRYLQLNRDMMGSETAEQRQIEAARRDPNAFARCMRPISTPSTAIAICGCTIARAAHAASQTFLKALAGIGGFRSGSFKSWLYAIARNVTIDMLRAARPPVD